MSDPISDVSHYDGLDFWGPVDAARMDMLLGFLHLEPGARVLDIGCGRGEVLLRLVRRYGASVTGIDRSPFALAQARAAFAEHAPGADATFLEQDVTPDRPGGSLFDAIVWLGGPFVGGSFRETVRALATWIRPGGYLLIGHGFWAQPPPAEYVEATGIAAGELTDHAGNIECGTAHGLRPLYCRVSTRDEWDLFEGTIQYNRERYAVEHPEAPDPHGRLERTRTWFLAQQRWGRETLGFGFYLFSSRA